MSGPGYSSHVQRKHRDIDHLFCEVKTGDQVPRQRSAFQFSTSTSSKEVLVRYVNVRLFGCSILDYSTQSLGAGMLLYSPEEAAVVWGQPSQ